MAIRQPPMYWKVIAATALALFAVFVVSFTLFVANLLDFGDGPSRIYTYESDVDRGVGGLVATTVVVAWFLLFTGVQIVTELPSWFVLAIALFIGTALMVVMGLGLTEGLSILLHGDR